MLFLICCKIKLNGRSLCARFIELFSGLRERESDDRISSTGEPENVEEGARSTSESKKRVPSKQVEDQIRRLLEKSRRKPATDMPESAVEDPDQSEVSSSQKREAAKKEKARRRSVEEEEYDEEAYAEGRQKERPKDDHDTRRHHRRAADRGEEEVEEEEFEEERPMPERKPKRIDRATIGRLVKNKSFTKQFKRSSQEANELLNDVKVQNALKKIRNFAEKEKTASMKRKRTPRRAHRRADSGEEDDERPTGKSRRKKSSRSYRISEEAKASKSVLDRTKRFEELNRGLKKILTTRKKKG